jgi:hypothetical protein
MTVTSGRGEGVWSVSCCVVGGSVLATFEQHKAASAATLKLRNGIQSSAQPYSEFRRKRNE